MAMHHRPAPQGVGLITHRAAETATPDHAPPPRQAASEGLAGRPQIDLVRPRPWSLRIEHRIGLGYTVEVDEGVFATLLDPRRRAWLTFSPNMPPSITTWATCRPLPKSRAIDWATARRPALAAAKAANWVCRAWTRYAGEQHRPPPARSHAPRRLAPGDEAAQAPNPPGALEIAGLHGQEIARHVVARIVDDEIQRRGQASARSNSDLIGLAGRVGRNAGGLEALAAQIVGDRGHRASVRPARKICSPSRANRSARRAPSPSLGPTPIMIALLGTDAVSSMGVLRAPGSIEPGKAGSAYKARGVNNIMAVITAGCLRSHRARSRARSGARAGAGRSAERRCGQLSRSQIRQLTPIGVLGPSRFMPRE